MTNDQDNYEAYYGDKLWNLLPAIYRRWTRTSSIATGRCASW